MLYKKWLILSLLILISIESVSAWGEGSWTNASNNPLVNGTRPYQISLNISNGTGANNDTWVFCNGYCNTNFTDVRFMLSNTTNLSYWFENKSSTSGIVWVNVTGNGTVNMYYGNPAATTSTENGANTFYRFLDFENTLDGFDGGSSTTNKSKFGSYSINMNYGSAEWRTYSVTMPAAPYSITGWYYPAASPTQSTLISWGGPAGSTSGPYWFTQNGFASHWTYYDTAYRDTGVTFSTTQFTKIEMRVGTSSYAYVINDVVKVAAAAFSSGRSANSLKFHAYNIFYIDGLIIRKQSSTPATWASWTNDLSESTPPTPINCAVSSITQSSLNISCSPGAGNITDEFRFFNVNTATWQNGSTPYQTFTNLIKDTEYFFKIYAYNNSNILNLSYATVSNTTTNWWSSNPEYIGKYIYNVTGGITGYETLINISDGANSRNTDRWLNESNDAELNFWNENDKSVYVRLPSSGNYQISRYVTFNSSIPSSVNGTNTFSFFDDFETDLSKWAVGSGTPTINSTRSYFGNKSVRFPSGSTDRSLSKIYTFQNTTLKFWIYDALDSDEWLYGGMGGNGKNNFLAIRTETSIPNYTRVGDGILAASSVLRTIGWHNFTFITNATISNAYIDGVLVGSEPWASYYSSIFLGSWVYSSSNNMFIDTVSIANYSDSPPNIVFNNSILYGTPINISSWGNTWTNNQSTAFSATLNSTIIFNVISDTPISLCEWTGATQINCSGTTSYAYKNITPDESATISVQIYNQSTKSNILTWTVDLDIGNPYNLSYSENSTHTNISWFGNDTDYRVYIGNNYFDTSNKYLIYPLIDTNYTVIVYNLHHTGSNSMDVTHSINTTRYGVNEFSYRANLGDLGQGITKLYISNDVGTSNSTHIFLNGHANTNLSDIRFYSSGVYRRNYFIENRTTGLFYINNSYGGNVYIYYGNPSYIGRSNSIATFNMYEGFEQSLVNFTNNQLHDWGVGVSFAGPFSYYRNGTTFFSLRSSAVSDGAATWAIRTYNHTSKTFSAIHEIGPIDNPETQESLASISVDEDGWINMISSDGGPEPLGATHMRNTIPWNITSWTSQRVFPNAIENNFMTADDTGVLWYFTGFGTDNPQQIRDYGYINSTDRGVSWSSCSLTNRTPYDICNLVHDRTDDAEGNEHFPWVEGTVHSSAAPQYNRSEKIHITWSFSRYYGTDILTGLHYAYFNLSDYTLWNLTQSLGNNLTDSTVMRIYDTYPNMIRTTKVSEINGTVFILWLEATNGGGTAASWKSIYSLPNNTWSTPVVIKMISGSTSLGTSAWQMNGEISAHAIDDVDIFIHSVSDIEWWKYDGTDWVFQMKLFNGLDLEIESQTIVHNQLPESDTILSIPQVYNGYTTRAGRHAYVWGTTGFIGDTYPIINIDKSFSKSNLNINNSRMHEGRFSANLTTTSLSRLNRNTDDITGKTLSWWFYDSGETTSMSYGGTVSPAIYIGVNASINNTNYRYYNSGLWHNSSILRSVGWHNAKVAVNIESYILSIDDVPMFTGTKTGRSNVNGIVFTKDAGSFSLQNEIDDIYIYTKSDTIATPDVETLVSEPTDIIMTTWNFGVNNSWNASGSINHTWFRFANGTTLTNVSNASMYLNLTYSPHYTQNITGTSIAINGEPSIIFTWFNITIPNNVPVLASIGNKSVMLGQYLNITVSATDADNDDLTYGTNASSGTLNTTTGEFIWLTDRTGTFTWYFNASEAYGGLDSEIITVTVSEDFNKSVPVYNNAWQYLMVNETMTYQQYCTMVGCAYLSAWNTTDGKYSSYKANAPQRQSQGLLIGSGVLAKFSTNKTIVIVMNESYSWTLVPGYNLVGIERDTTLGDINTSVNTNCEVDEISYTDPVTRNLYTFICGNAGNASQAVRAGEAVWMNATTQQFWIW